MAAAAATKWAVMAITTTWIVGDILAGALTDQPAEALYVSPSQPACQPRGLPVGSTLFATGALVYVAYVFVFQ
ncbi:hypothetical protein PR003_g3597 [Phytophthora rubi]|nr:hypothetical protein PR001_g4173 [Phytophthora rubi]KAE9354002.1 hypothetical protein PR003_g3597 [Phytophthora rubi]